MVVIYIHDKYIHKEDTLAKNINFIGLRGLGIEISKSIVLTESKELLIAEKMIFVQIFISKKKIYKIKFLKMLV